MSFAQSFLKFEAIPLALNPTQILVRWDLKPSNAPLADYEFYIDRGEAQDQIPGFQHKTIDGAPFIPGVPSSTNVNLEQIAGPISALDFYQYRDFATVSQNLYNRLYYKIRMRKMSTQEEISTPVFSWEPDLDLVGLYIVDENNFLLEDTTGVPCFVHQRRRGGVQCTRCFDPIQKKRTISNCTTCYGTNWVDGFYAPIDVYIDLNPSPNPTVIQEWGESQPNSSAIFLANYPQLVGGDLIRELREQKLWRVVNITQTEKRRIPMLQFAQVVEVNPKDIEYKLPYDEDLAQRILRKFEEFRALREF